MPTIPSTSDAAFERIRRICNEGESDSTTLLSRVTNEILSYQVARLKEWLQRTGGMALLGGPFAGLRYLPESSGSLLLPKLVGSYESELHGVVSRIIGASYGQIIDIGCAEGYYAVGFASRMPHARVIACDTDPRARRLCQQLAELNRVETRVVIEATCTHQRLQELASRETLIICDIEGGEQDLLDPDRAPALLECDILVECHDFLGVAYSDLLMDRFRSSHNIEVIENTWVNPNSIPFLRGLKPIQKFLAVWEGRPGLSPWLFMTARGR